MSSSKDMMKAMEARLLALEEKIATLSVGTQAKKVRKSKKDSDSEDKPRAKREFKPSAAREAWRSLCDSVRAVHKKDAMKIAKLLKADGHMEPTDQQINAAIARFEAGETASVAGSASDTAMDTAAEESEVETKPEEKKKTGAKPKKVKAT